MNSSLRQKVVKILISNKELLTNRKMFYDSLNLEEAEYPVLNNQYMTGIKTAYDLFSDFLVKWVNRNSEIVSSVGTLCEILKTDGFRNVSGNN